VVGLPDRLTASNRKFEDTAVCGLNEH